MESEMGKLFKKSIKTIKLQKLTQNLIKDSDARLPILNILGVKVSEVGNRCKHDSAHIVHLGVQFISAVVVQVVSSYVIRQDILDDGKKEKQT